MRLLLPTLCLAVALPLNAGEPVEEQTVNWYDVEIIIFRQADVRTTESWPPDAGVPDIDNARPLFPPADNVRAAREDERQESATTSGLLDTAAPIHPDAPVPYVQLDESERRLNSIFNSLQRSSRYSPLVHLAWTQPPLDRNQSPQLRVTLPGALDEVRPEEAGSEQPDDDRPVLGRMNETRDDMNSVETPGFLQEESEGSMLARPLDGRVQLSVNRYLHLDLDLLYLPDNIDPSLIDDLPAANREWHEDERERREQRRRNILNALARGDLSLDEAEILSLEPEQAVFEGFRLKQYRRLRSRELHYIDHPVYGAIITVTPRKVSARLLETDTSSESAR